MNDTPSFVLTTPGPATEPDLLELRPYQLDAIEALRAGARAGHRAQILAAPTGSGKTVCATHLMREAANKLTHSLFVCDRVALVDQTSAMLDAYGVAHGVMQADHWRARPWERTQVASAQTLARRGWKSGDLQLLVYDECHTIHKSVTDFMDAHPKVVMVGLSATPFTKGLGTIFTNVINVATTDQLVAEGYLVPLKCYAGKAVDMTGAKIKFDGEWADDEIEQRGLVIIGDIVSEWTVKTATHFGGPVKTIAFSATVAHGEEICKRFQAQGFNFQQVSYKDGNDNRRRRLIEEFRQPNSEIVGLVSCEALAKGFDVPNIRCGISARPYRKSLSGHIQQLGRVMRPYPGKEFALWLDHSGNIGRFHRDTAEFFSNGVSNLDDGDRDTRVRKDLTKEEREMFTCGNCGFIMGVVSHCPACGWERPRMRSTVQEVAGELVEVTINGNIKHLAQWLADRDMIWRQLCYMGLERKHGDIVAAERFAKAQYRNLYGTWPRHAMRNITPEPPLSCLVSKVQSMVIAWAKRRAA